MDANISVKVTSDALFVGRYRADGGAMEWFSFKADAEGKLRGTRADGPPVDVTVVQSMTVYALYGFFHLLHGHYLAVITGVRRVCMGPNESIIYGVEGMNWLPVGDATVRARRRTTGDRDDAAADDVYISLLRRISSTRSFYFAHGKYDITQSVQRDDGAALAPAGSSSVSPPIPGALVPLASRPADAWRSADDRFFWNAVAVAELASAGADALITPILNGFVASAPIGSFGGITLTLLSRRARARQGTRFNMRGADRDGNVANYVETEQLLFHADGGVSSFVQTRGSIPLLWEQPVSMKYTPKAVLSPDAAASTLAFARHASAQLGKYGGVTAVNLIDMKKDQKALGEAYGAAVEAYATPALRYVWFDFHHECRNMKWQNLDKLLGKVAEQSASYGFYHRDGARRVVHVQAGVFRTNCMDNLDRTNVVQSLFARQAALAALPGALDKTRASGCSVLTSPFPEFESCFNNLWADNADALSRLYSGTGALKTDFTRTGKRSLAGALNDGVNSVMRYVYNNLADGGMQDAWDLFLGRFVPGKHHHRGFQPSHLDSHTQHAAGKSIVPLRQHLQQTTPAAFFLQLLAIFTGVTLFVAAVLAPGHMSTSARAAVGVTAASLALGGAAYLIVGRGLPLGRMLVSRPTFIRELSHAAAVKGADAPLLVKMASAGAAGMADAAAALGSARASGDSAGGAGTPTAGRVKVA